MNSNTVISLVKERIKDSSNEPSNEKDLKTPIDENNFINPKIFPLKRRRTSGKVPEYCDLLNFDWEKYNLPNSFNSEDRSNRIQVSPDGLLISYVGPGRNDSDAAAIRSNVPVPPQVGIYYFEVMVVNRGRDGFIAVGYAIKSASLNRLTGWEPGTIGYHADDGNLYRGAGTGSTFGPSYTTNDIVGCGINFVDKSIFFTKNGILIGEIGNLKDKFHLPFFPSVGCRTVGEVLSINFGITRQFKFDIGNFIKKKLRNNFEYPKLGINENDLILSYLIHCGHKRTAKSFMKETKTIFNNEIGGEMENSFKIAQNRRSVIEAIKQGNLIEIDEILRNNFPSFLMENVSISFKLDCLNFIELIRSNESESNELESKNEKLMEIIENGRRLTCQFPPDVIESNSKLLQDTLALLAYPKPSESPVGYLLQKPFKSDLADEIDLALLKHEGKSPVSPIHQLLKQTQVVMDELQFIEDPEISLINL